MLSPMVVALLVLHVLQAGDAGSADGGSADSGSRVTTDAGRPDAGLPWRWTHDGGAWLDPSGVTDLVQLRVGERAEVVMPFPVVLMQCDLPLIRLEPTEKTLQLVGLDAGSTRCGLWFQPRAYPHRTIELTVSP